LLPSADAIEKSLGDGDITAVLLTQVFGLIPEYAKIQEICDKYRIPLFYDSSHSFGVEFESKSAFGIGNAATASFHSTKVFSTIEGGAVVTNEKDIYEFAKAWRNFGIVNGEIAQQGINAKMHEFSAAFGLAVLPRIESEMKRRRNLQKKLREIVSADSRRVVDSPNASYFPVIFNSEEAMMAAKENLEAAGIFPRRYFFPSLDELAVQLGFSDQNCPASRAVSSSILCLPTGNNVNSSVLRKIREVFSNDKS
jgi:dTDP-4-amino-4,6-dideoxygalactose transaminase